MKKETEEYKVSVLMSVYNESEDEVCQAIDSVLNQSFNNFELIIVNDNPNNQFYDGLLEKYSQRDSRVHILKNEKNIGLAMSMNKASKIAKGLYLARMDSDDICFPDRFQEQVNVLDNGDTDLVFSSYIVIDEMGNTIKENSSLEIKENSGKWFICNVILKSYIHHPTVMMRKKAFESVKGYRNFPCSQDLDLWIRMFEDGCSFCYLDKPLLYYRIRSNSISNSKQLQQHITITYIKESYLNRLHGRRDSFSEEKYNQYITGRLNSKHHKTFSLARELLIKAMLYSEREKRIRRFLCRVLAFCISPEYRRSYITDMRIERAL